MFLLFFCSQPSNNTKLGHEKEVFANFVSEMMRWLLQLTYKEKTMFAYFNFNNCVFVFNFHLDKSTDKLK